MRISLEDRILANTSEWRHTNDIVRLVKGDKKFIIKALHDLLENKSLESKKESNKVFYKRKDNIETNTEFLRTLKVEQQNYDWFLEELEKIPKLSTKTGKLSFNAIKHLKHLEHLIDWSSAWIARINYQKHIGITSKKIANQRMSMINESIEEVMKKINKKYEKDMKLVQEHFQNHNKELKFKI